MYLPREDRAGWWTRGALGVANGLSICYGTVVYVPKCTASGNGQDVRHAQVPYQVSEFLLYVTRCTAVSKALSTLWQQADYSLCFTLSCAIPMTTPLHL